MINRRCLTCGRLTPGTRCPACTRSKDTRRGTSKQRGYGSDYRSARAALLAAGPSCWRCDAPATTADHVPPLREFASPELWVGVLRPACARHNYGWSAS